MGKITGICISEKRGTSKHPVDEAVIREAGELKTTPMEVTGTGRSVFCHRKKSMRSAGKALRLSRELLERI